MSKDKLERLTGEKLDIPTSKYEHFDDNANVDDKTLGADKPIIGDVDTKSDDVEKALDPETPEVEIEALFDPWAVVDIPDTGPKWSELNCGQKLWRVIVAFLKPIFLIAFLYIFVCSLGFLSDSFNLLGGKVAGQAFQNNEVLRNPVAGIMLGVLATVLVQSSSTSTSVVITMVGAGIIPVRTAIPIIMGANIGTSVTNTIVSMAQSGDRNQFRRAFGGATVHDMFNWLSVIILLPIEVSTHYLERLTELIVNTMPAGIEGEKYDKDILKKITSPFTRIFVKVNKGVISDIATQDKNHTDVEILHRWCNKTVNGTILEAKRCENLFAQTDLTDAEIGGILLVISLVLIVCCLLGIVNILNSLLRGSLAKVIKKFVNAEFPGPLKHLTGYVAILIGCGMTIILQSSSIFTSTLTPLVGVGIVTLDRVYPMTLGSNIGTTITGLLAALAAESSALHYTLQVAFCHLFFNITGIILFYPIPFTRIPIRMAKFLGNTTAKYRWFAIVYLIFMFFLFPAAVFGLSMAGWYVLLGVAGPIVLLIIIIIIIKVFQSKCPARLPAKLRTWKFLPICCRSLQPLDNVIASCYCCRKANNSGIDEDKEVIAPSDKKESKQVRIEANTVAYDNKAFDAGDSIDNSELL